MTMTSSSLPVYRIEITSRNLGHTAFFIFHSVDSSSVPCVYRLVPVIKTAPNLPQYWRCVSYTFNTKKQNQTAHTPHHPVCVSGSDATTQNSSLYIDATVSVSIGIVKKKKIEGSEIGVSPLLSILADRLPLKSLLLIVVCCCSANVNYKIHGTVGSDFPIDKIFPWRTKRAARNTVVQHTRP